MAIELMEEYSHSVVKSLNAASSCIITVGYSFVSNLQTFSHLQQWSIPLQ